MTETESKEEKLAHDHDLIKAISDGDDDAWAVFVERYTDWVLYKSKEWCGTHCRYNSGDYFCGLLALKLQRDGKMPETGLPGCDEGMDTYIWLFEQLKKRAIKYSGKNQCLLSTYVWTILNSKELYIDWLRNRYGRAF